MFFYSKAGKIVFESFKCYQKYSHERAVFSDLCNEGLKRPFRFKRLGAKKFFRLSVNSEIRKFENENFLSGHSSRLSVYF